MEDADRYAAAADPTSREQMADDLRQSVEGHAEARSHERAVEDLKGAVRRYDNWGPDASLTKSVSTFTDVDAANRGVEKVIVDRQAEIEAWLRGTREELPLTHDVGFDVGRVIQKQGAVTPEEIGALRPVTSQNVFVLLERVEGDTGPTYVIKTAYPR